MLQAVYRYKSVCYILVAMKYLFEMPNELAENLRQYAFENRKAKSVVCREALEAYLNLASLVPKIKGASSTRAKKSKVSEPEFKPPEKPIVAGKVSNEAKIKQPRWKAAGQKRVAALRGRNDAPYDDGFRVEAWSE